MRGVKGGGGVGEVDGVRRRVQERGEGRVRACSQGRLVRGSLSGAACQGRLVTVGSGEQSGRGRGWGAEVLRGVRGWGVTRDERKIPRWCIGKRGVDRGCHIWGGGGGGFMTPTSFQSSCCHCGRSAGSAGSAYSQFISPRSGNCGIPLSCGAPSRTNSQPGVCAAPFEATFEATFEGLRPSAASSLEPRCSNLISDIWQMWGCDI